MKMKYSSLLLSAAILLTTMLTPVARAQSAPPPESTGTISNPASTRQQDLADSQVLCAVGDYDNGELVLVETNRSKRGTAQWRVESTNKLVRLAQTMAAQGRIKATEELTRRALTHLAQIGSGADAAVRANAEELAGFIHERLTGDREKAMQAYRNAVRLVPGAAQARENLDRLKRATDLAAQNPQSGG